LTFETLVAIDNQTIPIILVGNEVNFNNYWKAIDIFVANLLTKAEDLYKEKIANVIPSLNKFIYSEMSNYPIKPKEEFRIIQGILIGIIMIACEGSFSIKSAFSETADAIKDPKWLEDFNLLVDQHENHFKAMNHCFKSIFKSK